MKNVLVFAFSLVLVSLLSCSQLATIENRIDNVISVNNEHTSDTIIRPEGNTIKTRFQTHHGFTRINSSENGIATYFRNLKLKPHGSLVHYYNGEVKNNYNVYDAVIDLPIGKRDLHQCADACMRLKADYLWKQKRYDEIHFNFTNGFRVDYKEWMKGKRVVINGNKTYWNNRNAPSNTEKDYWKYMELIFSYAGTLSLSKELKKKPLEKAQVGDLFLQGGSPGHAIIIIDMAEDSLGNKQVLLAQSYMPAQELQILKNPKSDSPWYNLNFTGELRTPEWTFQHTDLYDFSPTSSK